MWFEILYSQKTLIQMADSSSKKNAWIQLLAHEVWDTKIKHIRIKVWSIVDNGHDFKGETTQLQTLWLIDWLQRVWLVRLRFISLHLTQYFGVLDSAWGGLKDFLQMLGGLISTSPILSEKPHCFLLKKMNDMMFLQIFLREFSQRIRWARRRNPLLNDPFTITGSMGLLQNLIFQIRATKKNMGPFRWTGWFK